MAANNNPVYGIDLGTTYSCIARYDGTGSAEALILNNATNPTTPSVVTFEPETGCPVVGESAKVCMRTRPERTKAFVKREMGREFCSQPITVGKKQRKLSPVEAQACILRHLIQEANILEAGRGFAPISQAVITIPAKFDEQQRARTKLAAELAGIQVLGLIQEPTAAAVSYDIPAGNTVLVFDLGGGTLDVSIVTNNAGSYKTISTPTGDEHLGGIDWDAVLLELALRKKNRQMPSDDKVRNKLMNKSEECKKLLSQQDSDFELSDDDSILITEEEFEQASQSLIEKCMVIIEQAIANARKENPNLKIDFFLTVGGSSKMPMIKRAIVRRFGPEFGQGKTEEQWLRIKDPDTAIATGAAKYAYMLTLKGTNVSKTLLAIDDKATHSYGIGVLRGEKDAIFNVVKSTDPIVCSSRYEEKLSLARDTDEVMIHVLENDDPSEDPDYGTLSREIVSKPFPLGKVYPKLTPLDLSVSRDSNGMIHLHFVCDGHQLSFDVNGSAKELIDNETLRTIQTSMKLMEARSKDRMKGRIREA